MAAVSRILFVAPHPDDETLGCGGTIAKYRTLGHQVYWMIVTAMTKERGFSYEQMAKRSEEISAVSRLYGFEQVFPLAFPAATLGESIQGKLIQKAGKIVDEFQMEEVFLPFYGDAHSDHAVVFRCLSAACKTFRHPSVRRVLCYETLSETNFPVHGGETFQPNVYEGIDVTFSTKMQAIAIYQGELGEHPFPRSETAVRALAELRGSECGYKYAEGFMLLKEIR